MLRPLAVSVPPAALAAAAAASWAEEAEALAAAVWVGNLATNTMGLVVVIVAGEGRLPQALPQGMAC